MRRFRLSVGRPRVLSRCLANEQGLSLLEVMIASAILGVVVLGMASFFSYFNRQLSVQRKVTSAQSLRMMMNFYIFSSKAVGNSANIASDADVIAARGDTDVRTNAYTHLPTITTAIAGEAVPYVANQMLQQCINDGGNDCIACGTIAGGTITPAVTCNADNSNRLTYSISLSPSGRVGDVVAQGLPLDTNGRTPASSSYTYPIFYNSFGAPCGAGDTGYNQADCEIEVRSWFQPRCPNNAERCNRAETIEVRYSVDNVYR